MTRKVSFVIEVNTAQFKRVNRRAVRQGLIPLSAVTTQGHTAEPSLQLSVGSLQSTWEMKAIMFIF